MKKYQILFANIFRRSISNIEDYLHLHILAALHFKSKISMVEVSTQVLVPLSKK